MAKTYNAENPLLDAVALNGAVGTRTVDLTPAGQFSRARIQAFLTYNSATDFAMIVYTSIDGTLFTPNLSVNVVSGVATVNPYTLTESAPSGTKNILEGVYDVLGANNVRIIISAAGAAAADKVTLNLAWVQ